MAHHGQHDNCQNCGTQRAGCGRCGTSQPVSLGGTLAIHDTSGQIGTRTLDGRCPGSCTPREEDHSS